MGKKKKPSVLKIIMYLLFTFIIISWIHQTPTEKQAALEEKIADYEDFQYNCSTYQYWNVGKGGNRSYSSLNNDPQECLEKELFLWKNNDDIFEKGKAELEFDTIVNNGLKFPNFNGNKFPNISAS